MKRGSFILDGVDSDELKTMIQSRPVIEAPSRKINWKSVYGGDGDIPFDEGAYDNTNMDLLLFINGDNLIEDRQRLYDVLDGRGVYREFIPYFDPDKIYRVMLNDKVQFINQHMYGETQQASVKFTVKPYKYLVDNAPVTINGKYGVVTNPTNYTAQPIITISGNGPVTLTVNGKDFYIKNVLDTITLSCERQAAYQELIVGFLTSMNYQIASRDYPVFKPGVNQISATGDVTQIIIEPRWRSLV